MGVNKVVFGAVAIMDISDSTVTPDKLAKGVTAYDKSGEKITGTMEATEDLNAVLTEQEELIAELKEVLAEKASGGGDGSNNYAKFTATTASTTSFVIENPLGGIAKMVSIKAVSPTITSSRKIHQCCLDWGIKIGAVKASYSSGNVSYVMEGTEGTPNNGQFRMTDGRITLYRFNSATTWDTTCEYEVEIWQ